MGKYFQGGAVPDRARLDLGARAGFELTEGPAENPPAGRLRLLFGTPVAWRELALFGPYRFNVLLQKAVQRFLGGPRATRIRFAEGPAAGRLFECSTAEKYFLLGSQYEREVYDTMARLVSPGFVAYEIGAHVGYWALSLSCLCGPTGHVYAFEPSELNYGRLLTNLELNKIANVTPVKLAASDFEGEVSFQEAGSMSRMALDGQAPGEESAQVRAVRLDDFVYRDRNPAPNLLVIDVEGSAGNVLHGAERVLRYACPFVVCEVHSGRERNEVLGVMRACYYETSAIEKTGRFPRHVLMRSERLPSNHAGAEASG